MDQPLIIRDYAPADRAALLALLRNAEPWRTLGYSSADWDQTFTTIEAGPPRECYVIEVDGRASGLAVVRRQFLFGGYLELLAVAPQHRGRGLGRALLAHVEEKIFARSKNLFACVSDFNAEARRFYELQGYEEIGRLTDLLVAGRGEILLRKTSGPARDPTARK